jgi:glycosyltransferase involved in cell wall biosynthesis
VTVSTEPLRIKLLAYNSCVITIPNWVDERLWPQDPLIRPARRGMHAAYMGTCSHKPDLEMLEPVVRKLRQKFDFQLDVIGVGISSDWFNTISVPHGIAASYVNFAAWFRRTANWDIGLAPLQENAFNASKSAIKVYEYASVGLPTIASAVAPYKQVIAHGCTGLLCPNTEAEWYDALASLCSSPDLIDNLRDAIRSRTHWTLAANAEELRRLWRQALFGDLDQRR